MVSLASLLVNCIAFVGFSLLYKPTPIERLQASLFVSPDRPLIIRNFRFRRASVTIGELKSVVSRYLGVERTEVAFANAPALQVTQLRIEKKQVLQYCALLSISSHPQSVRHHHAACSLCS